MTAVKMLDIFINNYFLQYYFLYLDYCKVLVFNINEKSHHVPWKYKVYSLQENSLKYMSYFHKDNIIICLRYFGRTQFASRDYLSFETMWEYLSSKRAYRKLTTFYKMHIKLRPQYLGNGLPPTV